MTRYPPEFAGTAAPAAIDHVGDDAEERERGRARLRRGRPRQRGDHDASGFRLPPRVDDRAAAPADDPVIPHPRLGVDRLAHGAEQPQAGQVVRRRPLFAPAVERADRRRRGVEDVDLVPLDKIPEAVRVRVVGRALVHQAGGPVQERPVQDVAVPRYPTDVGRAPVGVLVLQVEHVLRGQVHVDHVPAGGVHDALGLSRRAARVEREERVLGVERLRFGLLRSLGHHVVPPVVPSLLDIDLPSRIACTRRRS